MFKKYNVRNVMQLPEKRKKQLKSWFKLKKYEWPSGKTTRYQGYENWLYDILLKTESEKEIETDLEHNFSFNYVNGLGKDCVYYPDVKIRNDIYEVKSCYTYKTDLDIKNKMEGVLNKGFHYHLFVFGSEFIYTHLMINQNREKFVFVSQAAYEL